MAEGKAVTDEADPGSNRDSARCSDVFVVATGPWSVGVAAALQIASADRWCLFGRAIAQLPGLRKLWA
jgi:hypothetical protein